MMDTSSKTHTQKCIKTSKLVDYEEKDRISSLPDDILCHILSFIPSKYAVRTSLLSTRWKPLWTSVPTLDFCSYPGHQDETSGFMDIVDRFLLLHNSPNINKFHLTCDGYHDPCRLNSWICAAIKHNVQELVLDLGIKHLFEIPQTLYTFANLAVLKLGGDVLFRVPIPVLFPSLKVIHFHSWRYMDGDSFKNLLSGSPILEELHIHRLPMDRVSFRVPTPVFLPSLKVIDLCAVRFQDDDSFKNLFSHCPALEKLDIQMFPTKGDFFSRISMAVLLPSLKVIHLFSVTFLDDNSFKNLLSGCPVLEELHIQRHDADNVKTLCICSSTLKKLHITNRFYAKKSFQYGVVIKTPALQILKLNDSASQFFDGDEIPFLVEADFRVPSPGLCYEMSDDYYNAVVGILGKISSVQHLRLYSDTLEVVNQASAYDQLLFRNLTHLIIDIHGSQLSMLVDLLGHIPNLIVLVFNKNTRWYECVWHAVPECVPKCLSFCLETIEFSGFSGSKKEMMMIRYLLENAMVLKHLTLTSCTGNEVIMTNILKFPRGSSTCQIDLLYCKCRSPVKFSFGTFQRHQDKHVVCN